MNSNKYKNGKRQLEYSAGQFAFFDIGGAYDDPEDPIRHFTIASSPTEDFIMISTRIRDMPYKKRLASLEEGTAIVKVRDPEGKFTLHEDHSKPAVFLSGGIGVTPFRSMVKYATDKQLSIRIVMFDHIHLKYSLFYMRGPLGMVKAMQNLVQNELQIQKEQIKIEEFTGY
jgi:glycine betaine catabolism B